MLEPKRCQMCHIRYFMLCLESCYACSTLGAALMTALEPEAVTNAGDHERLDLAVAPLVEKNLEFLNDCLDDIVQEQQKVWGRHTRRTCIMGWCGAPKAGAWAVQSAE